jgi:hypothetical protein
MGAMVKGSTRNHVSSKEEVNPILGIKEGFLEEMMSEGHPEKANSRGQWSGSSCRAPA